MRAIIHFSAFNQTSAEDYIVKEVAIVNPDASTMQNWGFQAPYNDLQRILVKYTKFIDTLYTHGQRRQRYLQQLLGWNRC